MMKRAVYVAVMVPVLLSAVAGLSRAQQASSMPPICWDCVFSGGNCTTCTMLTPGEYPGWSSCHCSNGVCHREGVCPLTVAADVSPAGTMLNHRSDVIAASHASKAKGGVGKARAALIVATSWRSDCRGRIVARNVPTDLAAAVRKETREIRI